MYRVLYVRTIKYPLTGEIFVSLLESSYTGCGAAWTEIWQILCLLLLFYCPPLTSHCLRSSSQNVPLHMQRVAEINSLLLMILYDIKYGCAIWQSGIK